MDIRDIKQTYPMPEISVLNTEIDVITASGNHENETNNDWGLGPLKG